MIITCPNCETRYNLPDDKIPAGGAKVKCSKCSQVFKAEHPPAPPEEEFEALLEEESQGEAPAEDEFEETFEDVAGGAQGGDEAEAPTEEAPSDEEPAADEPVAEAPADETEAPAEDDLFADEDDSDGFDTDDQVVGEDMPEMDDLFDDTDTTPAPDEGASPSEPDNDLFGGSGDDRPDQEDLFDDDEEDASEEEEEKVYPPTEMDGADEPSLFDDDDDDIDEDEPAEEDDDNAPLFAEDDDLSLDDVPVKEKGSKKSLITLIILGVVAVLIALAIFFKVWTFVGIDLADSLKDVPFIGQMFMEETGGEEAAAPGESKADRVRNIELKNVRQYYVPNEKIGNLFVVEGKAVNKFDKPKERIKVEVILFGEGGAVLTSQSFLCGNVLSQFQLQVQTRQEIEDGLSSEVGILSNNTFLRPDSSTPFMAVFFEPPAGVKEFVVKVVDVGDPE